MKKHPTLVLNAGWIPIHIVDWEKAISLIYNDKVKCLDRDYVGYSKDDWLEFSNHTKEYFVLRSPRMNIALPEIIVTKTFKKLRQDKSVSFSRQNIISRDGSCCAYCGKVFAIKDLNLDHIVPKSKGGLTSWSNIITSCIKCNSVKANRTPEEAGMPLLFHPKKPDWQGSKLKKFPECKSWDKFLDNVEGKVEYNVESNDE